MRSNLTTYRFIINNHTTLNPSHEDAPTRRVLWFKTMSCLGQIRPHRRDESWSTSLWKTFFVTVLCGNDTFALWLQEVSDRPSWKFQIDPHQEGLSWWPPLYLYRSLGLQKVSRLGGWSNHWPLSDNTQNENGTGGHETGSVMWSLWQRVGWLPHECNGSASFGAGSLHHPRKIWE